MEMKEIAEKTGLNFDGGEDKRLFYDEEKIDVYAPAIGYNKYRTMEKELRNYLIDRDKYKVYAWNDVSGWLYWKNEGGTNYIQITVMVKDQNLSEFELEQIKQDVEKTYDHFCGYHTIEEYIIDLNKKLRG